MKHVSFLFLNKGAESHFQLGISSPAMSFQGSALTGEGRDGQPPQGGLSSSRLSRKERQNPVQRASERFLCSTGVLTPCLDAGIWVGMPHV